MKKLLLLSLVCLAGAAALMLTTLNRSDAVPSAGPTADLGPALSPVSPHVA